MVGVKSFITICGILGLCRAAVEPPAENISQCLDVPRVNLIFNETVHADAAGEDLEAVAVALFPGEGQTNTEIITCLKITNLNQNDGAMVKTMAGGISSTSLVAVITSGFGLPLDYLVEIWSDVN